MLDNVVIMWYNSKQMREIGSPIAEERKMTREEMMNELEQYKKENGYYDLDAVAKSVAENKTQEEHSFFNAFFGDAMAEETGEDEKELLALARQLNREMQEQEQEIQEQEIENAQPLIEKAIAGKATHEEWSKLAALGLAVTRSDDRNEQYTRWYELKSDVGNVCADQEDIETAGAL